MYQVVAVIGGSGVGKTHFIKEHFLSKSSEYHEFPFPHYVSSCYIVFGRYGTDMLYPKAKNEGTDSVQSEMTPTEITDAAIVLARKYRLPVVIDGHKIMRRKVLLDLHAKCDLSVFYIRCTWMTVVQRLKMRGCKHKLMRIRRNLTSAHNLATYLVQKGVAVQCEVND